MVSRMSVMRDYARAPAGRSSTRGERSSRSPAHVAAGRWHARRSWIDGRVSSSNGYLYIAFFYFCPLTFVDCKAVFRQWFFRFVFSSPVVHTLTLYFLQHAQHDTM